MGTGADRKITTADRGVFTLFKLGPPTPTLFDCAPCACVCVLARSSIRSSRRYCGVVPILSSLASHAHYHGAASRLCVCVLVVCFIAPLDVMVLVALDEHRDSRLLCVARGGSSNRVVVVVEPREEQNGTHRNEEGWPDFFLVAATWKEN